MGYAISCLLFIIAVINTATSSLGTKLNLIVKNFLSCVNAVTLLCVCIDASAQVISSSPKGASLTLNAPQNGAVLTNPIKVNFELRRMMIMPAGVPHTDAGHVHVLVNSDIKLAPGTVIPRDKKHIHFDKGERDGTLTLAPGQYTLRLVLADHLHRIHGPVVASEPIDITVVGPLLPAKKP